MVFYISQLVIWFQAANQCVVLKVLSVGPLGTLLAFTGLGQVLSALRDVTSAQVTDAQAVNFPPFMETETYYCV